MIKVHDLCDHSHWAHYRLQRLCPLKYLSGTVIAAVITLSVPCNDHTFGWRANAAWSQWQDPSPHWPIAPSRLISPGSPQHSPEEQWEEKPDTSCYLNLDTWHELIRCLVPGTRSIPRGRSSSCALELAQQHWSIASSNSTAAMWSTREMWPQSHRKEWEWLARIIARRSAY